MGQVVSAFGQSHVLFGREGIETSADVVFDAYAAIGKKIRAATPDVLIIISADHMINVTTFIEPPFAVAVGDTFMPFGDLAVPQTPIQGHREFAHGFIEYAAQSDFDIAKIEESAFKPDHGFAIPAAFINPQGSIPTVFINVNLNMSPIPSPKRAYALGTVLKDYIASIRPDGERVAVVGAGGLSHWLCVERDGDINEEWDKDILALFEQGRAEDLTLETATDIVDKAGNGGVEVVNWLMMAATTPSAKAKTLFYEPIYPWKTGMAAIEMQI